MSRSVTRVTLVWIDARSAIVVRWSDGPQITRHALDVPPHEKSAGHVRLVPGRHGGGRAQTGLETHRLEHLRQDLARIAATLLDDEDILILGPGTVREHLAAQLRAADEKTGRAGKVRGRPGRQIHSEPAQRMTEAQLVERLRDLVGEPPRRVR